MIGLIERIAALCAGYGAIFTVAEVGGDKAAAEMKAYTAGDHRLSSAYGFDFLYTPALTPQFVVATMAAWPGRRGEGWPSWAFENHDAPRAVSRWCAPADMVRYARMKIALLAALRGNIILFEGEELGLEQDDIPFAMLQDPEAIANYPLTLSRDGVRTPMPWRNEPLGGFTTGTPWLPLSPANTARAVVVQDADPASLLALTRQVLALRRSSPALRRGAMTNCAANGMLLRFERSHGGQSIACLFNLGPAAMPCPPSAGTVLLAVNEATPDALPAYSALYLII